MTRTVEAGLAIKVHSQGALYQVQVTEGERLLYNAALTLCRNYLVFGFAANGRSYQFFSSFSAKDFVLFQDGKVVGERVGWNPDFHKLKQRILEPGRHFDRYFAYSVLSNLVAGAFFAYFVTMLALENVELVPFLLLGVLFAGLTLVFDLSIEAGVLKAIRRVIAESGAP